LSIHYKILGRAGRDNALWVEINSGQAYERLLFDCGSGCITALNLSDIRGFDAIFFSHFHMDHIAGFDGFFRCTYDREGRVNQVFGPPDSLEVMHHRFRGFTWNLHEGRPARWQVTALEADARATAAFALNEAFARRTAVPELTGPREDGGVVFECEGATVSALQLDHRTPSLAYLAREKDRRNFDEARVREAGFKPGPWMGKVQDLALGDEESVEVGGQPQLLGELRERLMITTPGQSIAYLTDFLLDERARERLLGFLANCDTMVCEAQYARADLDLARQNYHTTVDQVAELARDAGVRRLQLFHLSDRYRRHEWLDMLEDARGIFPATRFPPHWKLTR
jgi:ribonuclease Z